MADDMGGGPSEVLVLVHPGSCCGSADLHLGKLARDAREAIRAELDAWGGGVLVADGGLSDELVLYPVFQRSIDRAVRRASERGLPSVRVLACDESAPGVWPSLVADAVAKASPGPPGSACVTGAWLYDGESRGCVGAVAEALSARGWRVRVSASALRDPEGPSADPVAGRPGSTL